MPRGAPIGAVVRITYDADDDRRIAPGDYLRTNAGRLYEILAAHQTTGKHPHRWRLTLLVIAEISPTAAPLAIVHSLVFNRRDKR